MTEHTLNLFSKMIKFQGTGSSPIHRIACNYAAQQMINSRCHLLQMKFMIALCAIDANYERHLILLASQVRRGPAV